MKRIYRLMLICLAFFIAAGSYLAFYALREIGKTPSAEEMKAFEKLSYFKGGKFQSPQEMILRPDNVRNGPAGWSRFFTQSPFAPKTVLPHVALAKKDFPVRPENLAFYWLGHSAAIMELGGKRIIFDPVLENAAPLPLAVPRYNKSPIEREELPEIDYVVITHNHYDHLERKTVRALQKAHFVVPLGVGAALRGWGVAAENITELGWNDIFEQDGLQIIAQVAQHYSGRSKLASNETLWNAYVVRGGGKNIYWSGDSGYGSHFRETGRKFGPFDFATLEIDAWNMGWPNIHLFPHEAVQAAKDLGAKRIIPFHWAVFDLALHPWHESIDMVLDEAEKGGLQVLTPKMGEKIIPGKSQTSKWW